MQKMEADQFISKQIIKPSSPTPQNLRPFKMSFIDQLCPIMHIPILLFYPNTEKDHVAHQDRLERLKTSLSKTLTHFYPMAGRVSKDNQIIEFDDEGVEFCETRVDGFLSDIFKQPDADFLHQLEPVQDAHLESVFLLKVQVNLFKCGGMVIGVSSSHKITDGSTMGLFIKAWSCNANGCFNESMLPKYILEPYFPSMEFLKNPPPFAGRKSSNTVQRRYVFDSSSIIKLKAKAASELVENPTRLEAICALIWKCATKASRTNLRITKRPSKACRSINVRARTIPPLPETSAGNCFTHFQTKIEGTNESAIEMDLQTLVVQLRKASELFSKELAHVLEDKNNAFRKISMGFEETKLAFGDDDIDFYFFTSWCHLEFYEADFGWGNPKWVTSSRLAKNFILLMDTSDGKGIEAWVKLSEQDMALFERNNELLEFASLNPSII